MSRYTVGQKVIVMFYELEGIRPWSNPVYLPWKDKISVTHMIELTITEAHKVAWDQDPNGEAKYDGYVAVDSTNEIWHNQYPRASYGQTTTRADHCFDRHYPDDTNCDTLTDMQMATFEDVTVVLDRVQRGIRELDVPNFVQSLQTHLEELTTRLQSDFGVKVEYKACWAKVPEITEAVLEWPSAVEVKP